MKNLVALVMVLLATSAAADFCSATLKDRNGFVMRSFSGFGYNMNEACQDARRQCLFEKERNTWDPRFRGSSCDVERRQQPRKKNCSFELVTRKGRIIMDFQAKAPSKAQACNKAQRKCSNELYDRQSRGRNMAARCRQAGGFNDIPRVRRSCSVTRVNLRGRVIQVHTRSALAATAQQAKQKACQDARYSCSSYANYSQRCIMDRRDR